MSNVTYGEHGRCEAYARSAERRCKRPAVGPHGKCDKHGGKSTGPTDPTLLEGNDHAEGNSGGGPPEMNDNAVRHGAWGDPEKFYQRLAGDEKAHVDEIAAAFVEESKADLPEGEVREKARELAVLMHQEQAADAYAFGDDAAGGRDVCAALLAGRRAGSKQRGLWQELRLYSTLDGRPHSEQ